MAELEIEQSLYEDMDLTQGGSADNGSLIIIISIVVLGLIGTSVLTIYMIRSNKHQRITEANKRHQQMLEL
jgi:flagellar basal body-associated protein FliL